MHRKRELKKNVLRSAKNKISIFQLTLLFIFTLSLNTYSFGQSNIDYLRELRAKMEIKKRLIQQSQKRLQYEKNRLMLINERERDLSSQLSEVESELWKVEETIRNVNDRRDRIERELINVRDNMEELKRKLAKQQLSLSARLKDIYMNREIDYFTVILEAESFSDFINRVEFLQRIVKNDTDMIKEVKEKRRKLQEEKCHLEELEAELGRIEKDYRKRQASYAKLKHTRSELLVQVQYKRTSIANNVYELETLTRDMELQLQKLIQEAQSFNESNKGFTPIRSEKTFIWPVRGVITSGYGYRMHPIRGRVIFHSGIDICAMYGAPILATASGVVIYSGWYSGYGNTVVIDHGGGYSSLYGHCSTLFVAQTQKVRQGCVIASVGSTGLSTGPHLHFEIRHNGIPIDPMGRL